MQLNIDVYFSYLRRKINDNWKWFSFKHEMETIHHVRVEQKENLYWENFSLFLILLVLLLLLLLLSREWWKIFNFRTQDAWRLNALSLTCVEIARIFSEDLKGKSTFCRFISDNLFSCLGKCLVGEKHSFLFSRSYYFRLLLMSSELIGISTSFYFSVFYGLWNVV